VVSEGGESIFQNRGDGNARMKWLIQFNLVLEIDFYEAHISKYFMFFKREVNVLHIFYHFLPCTEYIPRPHPVKWPYIST
jgi:hypothetical protein